LIGGGGALPKSICVALTGTSARCDAAEVTRTHKPAAPQDATADASLDLPQGDGRDVGIDLNLELPPHWERAAGIVTHFAHTSPEGWRVTGTVSQGARGLVISKLEVWPEAEEQATAATQSVTSRMLRAIPLGQILVQTQDWMKMFTVVTVIPTADEILAAHAPANPGPGRAPLPDELLRQVAEGYLMEIGGGLRGAVQRLAERLGRPEKTVSNWVAKARKEGWLGPASQGRAGATPGPRLLESRRS